LEIKFFWASFARYYGIKIPLWLTNDEVRHPMRTMKREIESLCLSGEPAGGWLFII